MVAWHFVKVVSPCTHADCFSKTASKDEMLEASGHG